MHIFLLGRQTKRALIHAVATSTSSNECAGQIISVSEIGSLESPAFWQVFFVVLFGVFHGALVIFQRSDDIIIKFLQTRSAQRHRINMTTVLVQSLRISAQVQTSEAT
jgi:hypothetical protein